jgi:hypothetical protein
MRLHTLVVLAWAATTAAVGGTAGAAERASIPFAAIGNIRDWHAASADELYVIAVNRARVGSIAELTAALAAASPPLALQVARGGARFFVVVR